MTKFPRRYLGDGVYASYDGYHIWLHLGHHEAPGLIALEPEVLRSLNEYDDEIRSLADKGDGGA